MRPRISFPALLAVLATTLFFVVSCSSDDISGGDCLSPKDGQLVAVPCSTTAESEPSEVVETVSVAVQVTPDDIHPGQKVFEGLGTCFTCHVIDSSAISKGAVGPNLSNIGSMGEAHIRESIINPGVVIAEECPTGPCTDGVMPTTFTQTLTEQQIDDVVAYLLELK